MIRAPSRDSNKYGRAPSKESSKLGTRKSSIDGANQLEKVPERVPTKKGKSMSRVASRKK